MTHTNQAMTILHTVVVAGILILKRSERNESVNDAVRSLIEARQIVREVSAVGSFILTATDTGRADFRSHQADLLEDVLEASDQATAAEITMRTGILGCDQIDTVADVLRDRGVKVIKTGICNPTQTIYRIADPERCAGCDLPVDSCECHESRPGSVTYDLEIVHCEDDGTMVEWHRKITAATTGQAIRDAKDTARARSVAVRQGVTWAMTVAGRLVAHDVIPLVERTRKDDPKCVGCYGMNDLCECPDAVRRAVVSEGAGPGCTGATAPPACGDCKQTAHGISECERCAGFGMPSGWVDSATDDLPHETEIY